MQFNHQSKTLCHINKFSCDRRKPILVLLEKMTEQDFEQFMEKSSDLYAQDLIKATGMTLAQARQRISKQRSVIIPNGLRTENVFFMKIHDSETKERVGSIWWGVFPSHNTAFIIDIYVDDNFRGKGLGSETISEVIKTAKEYAIGDLSLHVFRHNPRAKQLYERIGFKVVDEEKEGYKMVYQLK